jgi:hypothetical protein
LGFEETPVSRIAAIAAFSLIISAGAFAQTAPAPLRLDQIALDKITLEQIMADPDWIAGQIQVPEEFEEGGGAPYFSVDGKSVYYKLKRNGSPVFDLRRIDLADGKDSLIDAAAMASADGSHAVYDATNTHAAFVRNGDVFLRDLRGGATTQVTRDGERQGDLQFSADGHLLSFHSGDDWFVHDIASGTTSPAATDFASSRMPRKPWARPGAASASARSATSCRSASMPTRT